MTTDYYLSQYGCPVCKQALCIRKQGKGYLVWCGMANCYSMPANEGAHARTEKAAVEILYAKVNNKSYKTDEGEGL